MRVSDYNMGIHVPHDSIGTEISSCPICNSKKFESIFLVQTNPIINLNKCEYCNAVFVSHYPLEDFLSTYYSAYYRGHDGDHKVTTDSVKRFAKHITKLVSKNYLGSSARSFKILDYGGGDGSIAMKVATIMDKDKLEFATVDVFENFSSIEGIKKIDGCNYKFNENDLEDDYDLVIASGVLEHLKNPLDILNLIINRTVPGGVVYIRTPYIWPTHRLLSFFGFKQDFGYPAHFFDFSPQTWDKITLLLKEKDRTIELVHSGASPSEVGITRKPILGLISLVLKIPTRLGFRLWKFPGGYEVLLRKNIEP